MHTEQLVDRWLQQEKPVGAINQHDKVACGSFAPRQLVFDIS